MQVGGNGIAGPARTMKDYEDQLGALKKENFNLKLRIYFLEERMGITSANEDAIQKNIELKVRLKYFQYLLYLFIMFILFIGILCYPLLG